MMTESSLLSLDLLNKPEPEPFPFLNILDDDLEWDLEDHDEWALTDEQLEPNVIEPPEDPDQRRRGNLAIPS